MAPTTLKKKRTYPPLPEVLGRIHTNIEGGAEDGAKLLEGLKSAVETPWPYEKGDLCQWTKVLDILDKHLEQSSTSNSAGNELVVAILRFSRILVENCSNRHIYNSYEHLRRLFQWDDCEVVMGVLRVLSVLATPRSTRQMVCRPEFLSALAALASGCADGAGAEHISLLKQCSQDVGELLENGTRVTLQIYRTSADTKEKDVLEGLESIRIEGAHQLEGTEDEIVERLVTEHQVPEKHHFLLRLRVRLARVFPDYEKRLQWVRVKIMSATVLAQCQGASSFGANPAQASSSSDSQLSELMELLQPPAGVSVPLDLQTLALKALTALLTERSKQTSILSSSQSHQGILSAMIRKVKTLVGDPDAADLPDRLRFGEALFAFTWMFAGSASGSAALNNAGIMHLIVPVLKDNSAWFNFRGKFLTLAVKTLEVLMNYSQDMQSAFRGMDGIDLLINRASEEVNILKPGENEGAGQGVKAAEAAASEPSAASRDEMKMETTMEVESERLRLLGAILNLLSSAATPLASPSEIRDLMTAGKLPSMLITIFKYGHRFGTAIFEKAACLLTEFVHNEPGCLQTVLSSGVSLSFLTAITSNLPISRGVVTAVPSVLGALCLSSAGSQAVESAQPFPKFLNRLCADDVVAQLQGECPSNLGVQLEELMRHNPSLLDSCMAGCVGMATQIPVYLDSLSQQKEAESREDGVPDASRLSPQIYVTLVCEFLGKLLEPMLAAAEHARAFVRKDGAHALLQILARPEIPAEFARSDAGRFIIVVLGKSAFLQPSKVLGEVMKRTNKSLAELRALSSPTGDQMDVDGSYVAGEKLMIRLDLLINTLCGIVGHFRGSATAMEWNNKDGTELIDSLCKLYLKAHTDSNNISSSAGQETEPPAQPAPLEAAAIAESEVQPASDTNVGSAATQTSTTPATAIAGVNEDPAAPIWNTIGTLIFRLSNSLGMVSRRRPDNFDSAAQTHEKALSKMLAKYLAEVIKVESKDASHAAKLSLKFKKRVHTVTVCLLGDDSNRNPSRSGVNMILLQAFDDEGGLSHLGNTIKYFLTSLQREAATSQSEGTEQGKQGEIVERCIQLAIRLLTTPLTSMDRTGAQVTPAGFDKIKFLDSLKITMFEAISSLWEGKTTFTCPPAVVTPIFELMVQLLKKTSTDSAPAGTIQGSQPARRQVSYDPQTVTALMEMGFEERRVHTALDAIGVNSVELATEWLFMHSVPEEDDESDLAQAMALSLQQPTEDSSSKQDAPATDTSAAETPDQIRDRTRSENVQFLSENLLNWSIKVLSSKDEADFAITDALVALVALDADARSRIVGGLEEATSRCKVGNPDSDALLPLLHTLAILMSENTDICSQALRSGLLLKLADLAIEGSQTITEGENVPKWLSPALLAVHSLLQLEDDSLALTTFKEEMVRPEGEEGSLSKEASLTHEKRGTMIKVCVHILNQKFDAPLLQAVLQVCARLTKEYRDGLIFLQEGGLQQILTSAGDVTFPGHAMLVSQIVHHLLEDSHTLQASMQHEIRSNLAAMSTRHGSRSCSVRNFLSSAWPLIQRDPNVFVRAVRNCCKIATEGSRRVVQLVDTKIGERPEKVGGDAIPDKSTGSDFGRSRSQGKASIECMTKIVNTLVCRLVESYREPAKTGDGMEIESPAKTDEEQSTAISAAHLLRYLTEHVRAYPGCAMYLAKYTLDTQWSSKPTSFLQFLIQEVLPGDVPKGFSAAHGLDRMICRRSAALLLALLPKGIEVRRRVLAEIVIALNSPPTIKMTPYLTMLHSIGDVLYTFLTVRSQSQTSRQPSHDVLKLTTEANVPQALCQALGRIDLHHPHACKVSTALLRPLDVLCTWTVEPTASGEDGKDTKGEGAEEGEEGADFIESNTYSVLADEDETEDSLNPLYNAGPDVDMLMRDVNEDVDEVPDSEGGDEEDHDDEDDEEDEDDEDDEDGDEDGDEDDDPSDPDQDMQGEEEDESQLQDEQREMLDEEYNDMIPDVLPMDMYVDADQRMLDEIDEDPHQLMGHPMYGLFERIIDNSGHSLRELPEEMAIQLGSDLEIPTDSRQQVLSLVFPPDRDGMSRARLLHNHPEIQDIGRYLPFPRRDMGAVGDRSGNAGGRQGASAHDEPITQHPLLVRRQDGPRQRSRNGTEQAAAVDGFFNPGFANLLAQDLWSQGPGRQFNRLFDVRGRMVDDSRVEAQDQGRTSRNRRWHDMAAENPFGSNRSVDELEQCLINGLSGLVGSSSTNEPADLPTQATSATQPASQGTPGPSDARSVTAVTNSAAQSASDQSAVGAEEPIADVEMQSLEGFGEAGTSLEALGTAHETDVAAPPQLAATSEGETAMQTEPAKPVPEADTSEELQESSDAVESTNEEADLMAEEDEDDLEDDLEAALRLSMENVSNLNETEETDLVPTPAPAQQPPAPAAGSDSALPAGRASTEDSPGAGEQVSSPAAPQTAAAPPAASPEIDPAFLAEIPAELRAEVLAQQERQAAAAQLANSTAIDPDFLAALPPDIQADVIRQHQREEQERRRQQELAERPEEPADISRSEDMDNASFLATLSQELREEVLLTADEAFLASLPPHLAAEAAILRDRANDIGGARYGQQYQMSRRQIEATNRTYTESASARQAPAHTSTAERVRHQVIEESHVDSIIRLLFVAQPVQKSLMNKILVHLASHAPTREASLKLLLAAALQADGKEMPMQILYGSESTGFFTDGNPAMAVLRRSLEAISHMASQDNNACKVLLKEGFVSSPSSVQGETNLSEAVARSIAPFHALLALLAGDRCYKSAAMQEQLLQLLNFSITAATSQADTGSDNPDTKIVPRVSPADLHCLTTAISNPNSSAKAMDRAISLLRSLSVDAMNMATCATHLVQEAEANARETKVGLRLFCASQLQDSSDLFLGECDVKFLKLLKILKSVWPSQVPENVSDSENILLSGSMADAVKQDELWELLGKALHSCKLQKDGAAAVLTSLSPIVSRLQPLVEAFLIVKAPSRETIAAASTPTIASPSQSGEVEKSLSADGSTPPSPGSAITFGSFSEQHRDVLNMYIRQDKSLLNSMAFSPLVSMHKLLDFDNKKHYFRSELKNRNTHQRHGTIRLNVRRDFVFEDSFHQIMLRKPDELKGRLSVVFNGEEGVDAGGLSREWYLTLSKQMLNPDKALFIHAANGLNYQPNPASTIQPDHLKYFKFAGLIVGKALWDEQLLDAHFTLSMYKHMLNQPIEYKDVESIDPEYYRNLGWMLENDITDILEETFSVVREQFGVMLTIDLKPDGRNIPVTNENKHEYVNLVAEQVMTKGIKEQVEAFKEGFHQMMPPDLVSIFTCSELELLMCGLPSIDVDDLRANTEYTGYNRESQQIQWFWKLVLAMGQEDLARLVQFVTGTSQVPMEGFKALRGMNGPQKFNIHRCGDATRLPSSHTCFNQLDLPEYPTEELLSQRLLSAIREGFEGFGFS